MRSMTCHAKPDILREPLRSSRTGSHPFQRWRRCPARKCLSQLHQTKSVVLIDRRSVVETRRKRTASVRRPSRPQSRSSMNRRRRQCDHQPANRMLTENVVNGLREPDRLAGVARLLDDMPGRISPRLRGTHGSHASLSRRGGSFSFSGVGFLRERPTMRRVWTIRVGRANATGRATGCRGPRVSTSPTSP